MKQRLSHRMSLAGAAGAVVLAGTLSGCNSGSETTSAPASSSNGKTAANAAAPDTASTSAERSHTGTAVKPAAGFGNAQGRVLWNEKPAAGVAVQLCEKISFIGGCSGKTYAAKTDSQGNYTVDKV